MFRIGPQDSAVLWRRLQAFWQLFSSFSFLLPSQPSHEGYAGEFFIDIKGPYYRDSVSIRRLGLYRNTTVSPGLIYSIKIKEVHHLELNYFIHTVVSAATQLLLAGCEKGGFFPSLLEA